MRYFTLVISLLLCYVNSINAEKAPNEITYNLCIDDVDIETKMSIKLFTIESDDCATAMDIGGVVTDMGTTTGMTDDDAGGEPLPTGLTAPYNSVWYNLNVSFPNNTISASITATGIVDPVVSIFEDGCYSANPPIVEMSLIGGGILPDQCLPPGNYKIRVASSSANAGTYTLTVNSLNNPPSNDDCANAGTVSDLITGTNTVTNVCSSDGFVWYPYTVVTGDFVTVSSLNPNFIINNVLLDDCGTIVTSTTCLTTGDVIHIEVGSATNFGMFDIDITEADNPLANDDCGDAGVPLGTLDCMNSFTENGDVTACPDTEATCVTGVAGVWYSFDIDATVNTFDITGNDFEVFTGACGSLISLACAGDPSLLEIDPSVSGTSYTVLVFDDGVTPGTFTTIANPQTPINDDCTAAVILADGVTEVGNTSCATADLANPGCAAADENTVWYQFTLPPGFNGARIEINNLGITGDVSVQVGEYDAAATDCNADPASVISECRSTAVIPLLATCLKENTTYFIQVGSAAGTDAGDFDVNVIFLPATVPNDFCSQAQLDPAFHIDIAPSEYCQFVDITGTSINACPDDVMSAGCDYSDQETVWFLINVPADPILTVMDFLLTDGTQGAGQFSVFDNVCDPFSPLAGAECGTAGTAITNVPITPGNSYLVAISSTTMTPGTFTFSVKVTAPPANDLCDNAEIIAPGGSTVGTTECATNSMDYDFSTCAADLNESDVWYEIPITSATEIINITISGWTGAGNFGAAAYFSTGGCGALEPASVSGTLIEDCAATKMFQIPVKCLDPSITSIYIKVGSPADDGDAGNGMEQGQFNILIEESGPSCTYAETCADITESLAPVTPPDGSLDYVCAVGCLDFACPETEVGECDFANNPTVWFQVDTDLDAEQLHVTVETPGSWQPEFAIYQGACGALTAVAGGVGNSVVCNTDDSTPEISSIGIQTDAGGAPIQTYYIAVSANGVVDNPEFEVCAATGIGIVTCLGGVPGDPFAHTCDPQATFTVLTRSNDPDGSLGLPLTGPFCPGEKINLQFAFLYDATATGQDWLQGVVPTFGDAIDLTSFDPTAITVSPGGAAWFPDGNVNVNENIPLLCTYTDANGNLKLCNELCEACPCSGPMAANTPLPGGWFWVSAGGAGCANDGNPNTMFGIPGGTVVNVEFEVELTVKQFTDFAECAAMSDEFSFSIQTFSDGVTGCWEDPLGECLKDVNQKISFPIECLIPPGVTATPNPKEICSGEDINVNVFTDDGSGLEIEIIVEDNPNVDGEMDHTFFGSGTINDVLTNTSGSTQIVLYIMRALDPSIFCPGPLDTLEVIVHSEIEVDFTDVFVCEGECIDISPNSITGGTGNYTTLSWSTGESGNTINVCPTVATTYVLTVEDDFGCTGTGEIEVDVKPAITGFFDPTELTVCSDGVFNNDPGITVTVETGSPNYTFNWSSDPFGLDGIISTDWQIYNGDTYQIEAENSLQSIFGPYDLCVEIVDEFGCMEEICMELNIQGAPDGTLQPTAPLVCGQTTVDLVATFDQGTSIEGFDQYELFDCSGAFIEAGPLETSTWADLDLTANDCFVLLTYNLAGCVDMDTLQLEVVTGEEAILLGDSTICDGETAMINVSNGMPGFTYQWSSSESTQMISVTPDTTTIYIVTVTDLGNCTDVASFEVVVNDIPEIQIAGSTSYCQNSSTSLVASTSGTATYIWTNSNGDTISQVNEVTISSEDDYNVEVTVDGCANDSTIFVEEKMTLDINLNNPILCDGSIDTLFAGNGFDSYVWTQGGTVIPGADTSFIEINAPGDYGVMVNDNGCSGADVVTIENFQTPMATVTDTVTVCNLNNGVGSVVIDFTAQVSGATGTWTDLDLSSVDLANLSAVSFDGIARDTYSFEYTTNTAQGNCENQSYIMEVIVINCPCPVVATRPIPDQCNNTGNILGLNDYLTSPTVQIGSWTYVSGPMALTVVNDSIDLSGALGGSYVIRWSVATPVGNCPDSSEQTIVLSEAPNAEVIPGNYSVCNASTGQGSVTLDLNTVLTASTAAGSWMQTGGSAVPSLPIIDGTGLTSNEVLTFVYTTNTAVSPCVDEMVTVDVLVRDCSCPLVVIDPLPELCNSGTTIELNDFITTEPSNLFGVWSTTISPSPITGSTFDASGLLSGQFQVTFTLNPDPGGDCQAAFDQDIIIRRQPVAVAMGPGTVCSANASGNDVTTVDLFTLLENNPSSGNWSQTGGSPMLMIDANGVVDFNGQAINASFEFTYMTNSAIAPCTDVSAVVNVNVVDCNCPNIDINPVGPLCNTELDLDLSGLQGSMIAPGSWSVTGPNGAVGINGSTLTLMDLEAGNYDLTYTLDTTPAGSCQPDTTQVLVIVEQRTATVTPTAEACSENVNMTNGNVISLVDLITAGPTNGTWTLPNGDMIAIPEFADFSAFNAGDVVTVTYTLPSDTPCTDLTYTVDVDIVDCQCMPIMTTDFEACDSEGVIDLTPYGDSSRPGIFESTEVTINGTSVDVSTLNGNYTIAYVVNAPEPDCPDREEFLMTVIAAANPGTPSNTALCVGMDQAIDLFDLLEGEDAGGTWSETSNQSSTGGAFNVAAATFTTNGQAVGTYKFTYEFTGNAPCPDVSTEVEVVIQNIPPVDAGEAQTLDCNLLNANLGGTAGNTNFTYAWTHDGGLDVPNSTEAQTQVDFPGVFTLTVTDINTGCISTDQVTIDLSNDRPGADLTSENVTCFDASDGIINVINTTGGTPEYQYSNNGGTTFQNSPNFLNLDPGSYDMVVSDAGGCIVPIGTIEITQPAELSLNLGEDQVVTFEDRIPLSIAGQFDADRITSIEWVLTREGVDSIIGSSLTDLDYEYFAQETGTICVTISDDAGCTFTDCINIRVIRIRDVTLPQIFFPSSEEGNETFFVNDNDVEQVRKFYIYDRWGNKVFSAENTLPNDPSAGWNGTFDGKDVEPGVYVYFIEFLYKGGEGEIDTKEGDITVIR